MKRLITKANVFSTVLFSLSILILGATIFFTLNVHVLKDWVIVLPDQPIHVGDTITIQSQYTKLKPVKGVAHRYIECQNKQGSYIRYEINSRNADHAPGTGGTGILLTIPNIPGTPSICKISINVDYKVYLWRNITEFNSTKTFTLLPAESSSTSPQSTSSTSQAQASTFAPVSSSGSSSSNSTPVSAASLPDNPQTSSPPPTPTPEPVRILGVPLCIPLTGVCVNR